MPRIPFADRDTFPEHLQPTWDAMQTRALANGSPAISNVFRTMGNVPELAIRWVGLLDTLRESCGLDARSREILVLRCAQLYKSRYEWHQHVSVAHSVGVSEAEIDAVVAWRQSPLFDHRVRAVLEYAEAVGPAGHDSGAALRDLSRHFTTSEVVAITMIVVFYSATAMFLDIMDVETEGPFVGWPSDLPR